MLVAAEVGCYRAAALAIGTRTTIPHLPALDGLRGMALFGVLLFHAGGTLKGGYLGVDLFFVLSGYLITSLLLGEYAATGTIALSSFWVRRARRLFPALLALMPAIALYARFFAKPIELQGLRADALATLAYVANWRAIYAHKSYWQLFAAPSPLEHCWSLAIEEQFYVIWPLVVAFVLRITKGRMRLLLALTIVLCAASMIAMLVLFQPEKTSRVYLGTDTRAASILVGAALAILVPPHTTLSLRAVRRLDVAGFVSIAGLTVAWIKLEGASWFLYHGGFWLTEVGVLVLIVCAVAGERSYVARLLSLRPLTALGTISYGTYLWHWPVDCVVTTARFHLHGFWLHVLQLAITLVVSLLSYYVVERPIRRRGLGFGRPIYVVPSAVALAVAVIIGGTHARADAAEPTLPPLFTPNTDDPGRDMFRVMVLGDSTANSLGWGLRGVRDPGVAVDLLGQDGCTMLMDQSCGGPDWAAHTKELKPNATLMFLGGAFLHGTSVEGEWQKSCHPVWIEKFERHLAMHLPGLLQPSVHVFVVTLPYPLGEYDTPAFRAETDCINASLRRSVAKVPGVGLLELGEHLCPHGECQMLSEGTLIRPDGIHYNITGAAELSRWILAVVGR